MVAGDHLSTDQFEIVHPHRAVRIGGRMFPAAVTDEMNHGGDRSVWMRGALIPIENGSLAYVEHTHEGFRMNEPRHQLGGELSSFFDESYPKGPFKEPEELHHRLDALSKEHRTPEEVEKNRETLKWHREARGDG